MDAFRKKLDGYFIAFMRQMFGWSPAKKEALKRQQRKSPTTIPVWECEMCHQLTTKDNKHVDHIEPVVPVENSWDGNWNTYRDRLFVSADKLQVICKDPCHKLKTKAENEKRRQFKAKPAPFCQHDDPSWCTDRCPKRGTSGK